MGTIAESSGVGTGHLLRGRNNEGVFSPEAVTLSLDGSKCDHIVNTHVWSC